MNKENLTANADYLSDPGPPQTRITVGMVALLAALALLFGAVAAVVTVESNRHTRWVPGSGLSYVVVEPAGPVGSGLGGGQHG